MSDKEHSVYHLIDFDSEHCEQTREKNFRMDLISIVSETLAELAEVKDRQTGNHIKRVAIIGELLAREMVRLGHAELSEEFIMMLRYSIPLHDIGKVGIEDSILLKPGKLTEVEFECMKMHAKLGADILEHLHEKIKGYDIEYFGIGANIANAHHEKYDGSGYPKGLKGDEIPIEAQITAIADVLDALMSVRPYKKAFSFNKSFEIIKDGRGTHFNPDLVDILMDKWERVVEIYALLRD
jgi:putative two-component system response regulator